MFPGALIGLKMLCLQFRSLVETLGYTPMASRLIFKAFTPGDNLILCVCKVAESAFVFA